MISDAPSLRRRLAIGLSAGVTVLWLLAILGTGLIVRLEMDAVFDAAVQETAERLLPLAVLELIDLDDGTAQLVSPITTREEYLTYVVRDAAGRVLLQSHDADLSVFPPDAVPGFQDTPTHRIYALEALSGSYVILVAEPLAHRTQASYAAIATLVAPLFLLVPLSYLGIVWAVRRSLRPVDRLRAEVTARDGADLRPVSTTGLPAEVDVIARAVNQLLIRLKRTLEAEQSFTANAAHEIRTPIAAALAQTQRLMAEATEPGLQARATRIEAELHRLARLSEKLMQLARAEGGGVLGATPQDLGPVLAFVVDDFRRAMGAGMGDRLRLVLPEGPGPMARMDPDAFGILARNLIENALRHGDPARPVLVRLTGAGVLSVANAGRIVPADSLAQLTTRFERGAGTGGGSGLGLAIAETIACAAGARLTLYSPARGQPDGFEAVLEIAPVAGV